MSDAVDQQIAAFEVRLRDLERELAELRHIAAAALATPQPAEAPIVIAAPVEAAPPPAAETRPPTAAVDTLAPLGSPQLEELRARIRPLVAAGRLGEALKVLEVARRRAVTQSDIAALSAVIDEAEVIGRDTPRSMGARAARLSYAAGQNRQFLERRAQGRTAAHPTAATPETPPRPATASARVQPAPPAPPRKPLFTLPQLSAADLFGATGLAIAGGVVTLLGIVFFFVLAVNRGWIGPSGRVALGSAASAIVFGAGFELRRRYRDTHAALAAVGVGIAGGFVTLLAAAALYDLLPAGAALAVCAAIAAVAVATSLAWRSQLVAGFGLIGAMLVPVAVAAQNGITVLGTSFVAVVFAATAIVAVRYRWRNLLVAASAVSMPQIVALTAQAPYHAQAPWRIVVLVGCFGALYLAAGVAYQLVIEGRALKQVSTSLITSAAFLAAAGAIRLYGGLTGEGIALLVVTFVFALLAAVLFRRAASRDLSAFLAAIALTIAAIAVADLLTGQPLAYAWTAEAAALAWLARRVRESRYQVWAAVYLVLSLGHLLLVDAPLTQLLVANRHPAAGAGTAAALALALLVFRRYAKAWPSRVEDRGGLFGLVAPALRAFENAQALLGSIALWAGGVLAAYAASLGLLGLFSSFAWGHVAVASLWSGAGIGLLVYGIRRGLSDVRSGALIWLAASAIATVVHAAISLPAGPRDWTFLVVATGLVAASFVDSLLRSQDQDATLDVSAALATAGVVLGAIGSAGVLDGQSLAFAWAAAAGALGFVARRTRLPHVEALAIAVLGLTLAHVVTVDAPPAQFLHPNVDPAGGVLTVIAVALAAGLLARWSPTRDLATPRYKTLAAAASVFGAMRVARRSAELWVSAIAASYAASLGLLAAIPSFDWAHVAVTGLLSGLGLTFVVAGALREARRLALGGVVWLGAVVVLVVVHGESELAPTPRSWSLLIIAAAGLAAGHCYQLWQARAGATLEPAAVASVIVSVGLAVGGVVVLTRDVAFAVNAEGAALLAVGSVYAALAASVFRRDGQRDYRTLLWAISLPLGIAAAGKLLHGTPLVLALAGSGAVLAWLATRTTEPRFLIAAGVLVGLGLERAIVVECPPTHLFAARIHPGSGAPAVLVVAIAVAVCAHHLGAADRRWWRQALAGWCLAGVLAVYGLSVAILDLAQRAFPGASLHTSFQRGHTAVSAFWALLGLLFLYAGLKRWRYLRVAGFAVLATSLAKIFLYDLPSLSSITRALSFLAVGAVLLLGGFFYQRLGASDAQPRPIEPGSA